MPLIVLRLFEPTHSDRRPRRNRRRWLPCWPVFGLYLLTALPLAAQSPARIQVSDPVPPYIIEVDLRQLPRVPQWQPGDPVREVPRWQDPTRRSPPAGREQADPLAPLQQAAPPLPEPAFAAPLFNFDGQNYTGRNPPDPIGAVGPNHYLQAVNSSTTSLVVYDKHSGDRVAGPLALSSFAVCSGGGDPIILFDALGRRWIVAEFGTANSFCMLISQTDNPVGDPNQTWYAYNFETPNKPDYFKIGIWGDAYYLGTNESGGSPVYALERDAMLQGLPARMLRLEAPDLAGFPFQLLMPAGVEGATAPPGNTPGLLLRHNDGQAHGGGVDQLELFECYADFNTPENSRLVGPIAIPISEFSSDLCGYETLACIEQPASSVRLDPIREPLMNRVVYRNFGTHEAIIGNFTVDVDGTDRAGIRWFELRRDGQNPWQLYQEGTYTDGDRNHRWIGSLAFDGAGNIALGFNTVGPATFPSLAYTGRLAGDPLGTLPRGENSLAEGSAPNITNRYGDYSSMSVDPEDDCTFWYTGQYNRDERWSTRIGAFRFESCGCASPTPQDVTATATGNDNEIWVSWLPVTDSAGYDVYRALGECGSAGFQRIAENLQDPFFTDTTPSSRVSYSYAVVSRDATLLCPSPPSACVSATTAGACTVAPTQTEAPTAITPGRFTCQVNLTWRPATAVCDTPIHYSVYRGTHPDFSPAEGHLVAACLADTKYSDISFARDITYYYKVVAEDAQTGGAGACNGGNIGAFTPSLSVKPVALEPAFFDDLEAGPANFTTSADLPELGWLLQSETTAAGDAAWFAANPAFSSEQTLTLAALAIPDQDGIILRFQLYFFTDRAFDGLVLEYSLDQGRQWFDVLAGDTSTIPENANRFLANGYPVRISSLADSDLAGRWAWSGTNFGFNEVLVDLNDFRGQTAQFRWRLVTDSTTEQRGVYLDNFALTTPKRCGCIFPETWPHESVLGYIPCLNQLP